jgi:hypothetical protein
MAAARNVLHGPRFVDAAPAAVLSIFASRAVGHAATACTGYRS